MGLFKLKLRRILFLATIGKNWATFKFNIWSHCDRRVIQNQRFIRHLSPSHVHFSSTAAAAATTSGPWATNLGEVSLSLSLSYSCHHGITERISTKFLDHLSTGETVTSDWRAKWPTALCEGKWFILLFDDVRFLLRSNFTKTLMKFDR